MKWFIINKSSSVQPVKGTYNDPDWKEQIRIECQWQCIYCALHENKFGGPRNFHIEHYKPKSIFKPLKKDIKNLYYACGICNTFKGDDWPAEWEINNPHCISYPDPSIYDYSELFVPQPGYTLSGATKSGAYIINKLFLNRPQLILERKEHDLQERYFNVKKELNSSIKRLNQEYQGDLSESYAVLNRYIDLITEVDSLLDDRRRITLYNISDVTKQKE